MGYGLLFLISAWLSGCIGLDFNNFNSTVTKDPWIDSKKGILL